MLVIGLTGGIASGKSEVNRMLAKLGAHTIDADKVGHQAYLPHSEAWEEVVAAFGKDLLQPNEEIDRKKLGAIVFSDPGALARLNGIMHTKMYRMIEKQLADLRKQGVKVVVLEAAILIEAKWMPLVDELWVVAAPEPTVVQRLVANKGLTPEQAKARINAQMSAAERAKHATVVINNDGGMQELQQKVVELWKNRVERRVLAGDRRGRN